MSEDVFAAKSALRKRIISGRDALGARVRHELGSRITEQLITLDVLRDARCIMAYASFGGEFDTAEFLAHVIASGRQLVLPRVDRATKSLQLFCVCDPARDLRPGVWGIREPVPERCTPAPDDSVQFVLVPGVAFTERGERLGYGGGFYDKLIARLTQRPALVAPAFSLQVVNDIPLTDGDRKVETLITEHAVVRCS